MMSRIIIIICINAKIIQRRDLEETVNVDSALRYFTVQVSAYHQYIDHFLATYFENGSFEAKVAETAAMIAPYVKKDPTAYCSYEDHRLAVRTITDFCLLRAESARGQLDGRIQSIFKGQESDKSNFVDASSVWLPDMGEVDDMKD